MHLHLPSPASCKDAESKKKHWKRMALQTCETGLEDQLTHLIYHHDLQKRTVKLEKSLKVPKRHQHDFGHVRLAKPLERTFTGIRIERPPTSRRNSEQGSKSSFRGSKTIWLDPELQQQQVANPDPDPETETSDSQPPTKPQTTEGECSVEAMCLSSYRALGWKGYHSEGRLLRTLFAFLFYDVLFVYIPNVFQTEFQTCPLDLHSDAFYPSRMSEVNARSNELSNGEAEAILVRVWEAHAERRTCVVGLDWSYEFEDLREICRAFPPSALSTVMKVFAQEYGQRGGGVPDLFLWKTGGDAAANGSKPGLANGVLTAAQGNGQVMFAEVKSENDRLSDTQRMWIDVLSGAGIAVELCHAVASEVRTQG